MVLVIILSCKLVGLKSFVDILPSHISQVYVALYTYTSIYYGMACYMYTGSRPCVFTTLCVYNIYNRCLWLRKSYEPPPPTSVLLSMCTYSGGTYRQIDRQTGGLASKFGSSWTMAHKRLCIANLAVWKRITKLPNLTPHQSFQLIKYVLFLPFYYHLCTSFNIWMYSCTTTHNHHIH